MFCEFLVYDFARVTIDLETAFDMAYVDLDSSTSRILINAIQAPVNVIPIVFLIKQIATNIVYHSSHISKNNI